MIDFKIKFDDTKVKLMLDQFPAKLQANIVRRLEPVMAEAQAKVRAGEPHRTGRLQAETKRFVDEHENWVRGRVRILGPGGRGHNVAAAALEYGSHKSIPVKGYRRGGTPVAAYRRRTNIAEQRFLRNAAEVMRPKASAELQAAIADTIADANK
jgi:hypothetical protein